MSRLISFVAFIVLSITLFAQGDKLLWNEDLKLSWEDFSGNIDEESPFEAVTYWNIDYQYKFQIVGDLVKIEFTVNNSLVHSKSWLRPGKGTDYLLQHEKLHFDIAELFARKLRKQYAEYKYSNNVEAEFKAIFNDVYHDCLSFEDLYDLCSDHSKNKAAQQAMIDFVENEILKLDEYKLSAYKVDKRRCR